MFLTHLIQCVVHLTFTNTNPTLEMHETPWKWIFRKRGQFYAPDLWCRYRMATRLGGLGFFRPGRGSGLGWTLTRRNGRPWVNATRNRCYFGPGSDQKTIKGKKGIFFRFLRFWKAKFISAANIQILTRIRPNPEFDQKSSIWIWIWPEIGYPQTG